MIFKQRVVSGKADVFPIGSRGGRYFKNPMAPYLSGKFGTRLPDQRGQKWSLGHLTVIALTIALNCLTRHQGLMSTSSRFSPSWTTKVSSLVVALLYLAGKPLVRHLPTTFSAKELADSDFNFDFRPILNNGFSLSKLMSRCPSLSLAS